jgi:hypothetical protein
MESSRVGKSWMETRLVVRKKASPSRPNLLKMALYSYLGEEKSIMARK